MMDRRDFFRRSLFGLRDHAVRNAPEAIRDQVGHTVVDISILTADPDRADQLCEELVAPHVNGRLLALRRSQLGGSFPGGIVLFENNRRVNHHDGISLLYAGLREIERDVCAARLQDPTLVRFMNVTPPFSRTVEIWRGATLVYALSLAEPGIYPIEGVCGDMVFEIGCGQCRVIECSCPHAICKAQPPIVAPGERIICLPGDVTAVIGALPD